MNSYFLSVSYYFTVSNFTRGLARVLYINMCVASILKKSRLANTVAKSGSGGILETPPLLSWHLVILKKWKEREVSFRGASALLSWVHMLNMK